MLNKYKLFFVFQYKLLQLLMLSAKHIAGRRSQVHREKGT